MPRKNRENVPKSQIKKSEVLNMRMNFDKGSHNSPEL